MPRELVGQVGGGVERDGGLLGEVAVRVPADHVPTSIVPVRHCPSRPIRFDSGVEQVHAGLILLSAALAVLFGFWCLAQYGRQGGSDSLLAALSSEFGPAVIVERAVSNGLTEVQVFRFPNSLCTDRGRAVSLVGRRR